MGEKISDVFAGDDVDIDIEEEAVRADRGAVAVGDDLDDSSVNTGRFEGIQNSGDGEVDADGAVFGSGNVTLNDSNVGAAAFGSGDATNVDAENANLGDGTINDINADNANVGNGTLIDVDSQGDGQTVVGSGNELTGDVDVDLEDVEGNANLAIGDGNEQAAVQDNDFSLDQSFEDNSVELTEIDNSVEDSFNLELDDSFNTTEELTSVVEDNDVFEDNDSFADNSVTEFDTELTALEVDAEDVEDTDLDVDA